ncbi:hypothetical protein [Enterobacter ludwigii]
MSTITREFTKEQLIAKSREQIAFCRNTKITGEGRTHVNQCSALFEIALASLEAEPVTEWTNEQCLEFLSIAFRHAEIKGDLELDDIRLGVKMVNGSRAAMLQGADGNSTVVPDGWVLVPVEPTKEMIEAGWSYYMTSKAPGSSGVYSAMLAAAPQQGVKQ